MCPRCQEENPSQTHPLCDEPRRSHANGLTRDEEPPGSRLNALPQPEYVAQQVWGQEGHTA